MHHLFVSRAGDSLVNVTQNRNTYRLLANFDGTNVILLQIDAGSVVWLTPDPERPVYLEYYTLLTGELTLHTDEGEAQTLCAGDSLHHRPRPRHFHHAQDGRAASVLHLQAGFR